MRSFPGLLALLACLALSACPKQDPGTEGRTDAGNTGQAPSAPAARTEVPVEPIPLPEPDPATDYATFAVIGNYHGFQKPCACTPEQLGGLARLGTVMQQLDNLPEFTVSTAAQGAEPSMPDNAELTLPEDLEPQPLWLIDLGNFAWSPLHYPGLRASTHLQILSALGARAAVPGATELGLDLDDAVSGLAHSPVPLVSCNLTTEASGLEIHSSIQLAENWYLIGISSDYDSQGMQARQDWWHLSDARSAALDELARLPHTAHILIAGSNLDHELATQLLADPRVECCIGVAENFQRSNRSEPALFRDPLPKSPELDLYSLDAANNTPVEDWRIELSEDYPDDLRVMDLIKLESQLVRERLRERRAARVAAAGGGEQIEFGMSNKFLPESERKFSFDDPPYYIGGEQCLHCHREAASTWRGTRHAGATNVLQQEGQAESLDCLSCHSTGLLDIGGYDPLEPDPQMAGVGCENCHGPGSHHVEAIKYPDDVPNGAGSYISRDVIGGCVRCHDPYNSPHFEYGKYWEQIRH